MHMNQLLTSCCVFFKERNKRYLHKYRNIDFWISKLTITEKEYTSFKFKLLQKLLITLNGNIPKTKNMLVTAV